MRGKRAKAIRRAILGETNPEGERQYFINTKNGEITTEVQRRLVQRGKKIWNNRSEYKNGNH